MSTHQEPAISRSARAVFWIGPPITILATLAASPRTAALLPVISLPSAYAIRRYHGAKTEQHGNFETCIWTYLFTSTAGIALAGIGELVLIYGFSYLFHGENTMAFLKEAASGSSAGASEATLAARAATAWSWQNVVQRVWATYVIAGAWEEALKYLPIAYLRRTRAREQGDAYLHYAIAAGLGFGTMENLLATYGAAFADQSWAELAVTLAERTIMGTLGHVLAASLAGLRTLRGDLERRISKEKERGMPVWQVLGPSAFWHGTGNFVLMSISAMEGHVGWVHPSDFKGLLGTYALAGSVYAMSAFQVWSEWRQVKSLQRANGKGEMVDQET